VVGSCRLGQKVEICGECMDLTYLFEEGVEPVDPEERRAHLAPEGQNVIEEIDCN